MVYWNLCQAHLLEVGLTQIPADHDFFCKFFFQHDRFQDNFHDILQGRFQNIFHNKKISPSNYLELVKNLRHIKLNQVLPSFLYQQSMQWSHNTICSHFTLCLRARDYIKRFSQHPWYGLWMRVKGPHHYKVTALAHV